jgi:hypothetical protein
MEGEIYPKALNIKHIKPKTHLAFSLVQVMMASSQGKVSTI